MNVTAYHERLLPQLTHLVNTHIRLVPPHWTLSEQQIAHVVRQPDAVWAVHYPDDGGNIQPQTLCVLQDERLLAAASWYFASSGDLKRGVLAWLIGVPDELTPLDLLIGAFAGWALAQGCNHLDICPRFAFGTGWFGLVDQWPHLFEVFHRFGFAHDGQWVIMTATLNVPPAQDLPDFQLAWNIHEEQLEWELVARQGDVLAGECQAWGIPAHFRGCPGFDEWITLEWVGVEEPFRRKGLARHLLQEQIRFHARRGVHHAMLWVEVENTPARKLYESLNFVYGPECFVFEKAL